MRHDRHDPLEALLRDAARTYNPPPDDCTMPLAEIWQAIDEEQFGRGRRPRLVRRLWASQGVRVAAALLVGIGIGRVSYLLGASARRAPAAVPGAAATLAQTDTGPATDTRRAHGAPRGAFAADANRYLGQAAALLSALPSDASGDRPDARFLGRARDLLLTTRLLLDSPAAAAPAQRTLLEDLELVLAQVVRLRSEPAPSSRTELELIHQALEQRDVLPRIRSAVAEQAAD